jgi:hypothetical protein
MEDMPMHLMNTNLMIWLNNMLTIQCSWVRFTCFSVYKENLYCIFLSVEKPYINSYLLLLLLIFYFFYFFFIVKKGFFLLFLFFLLLLFLLPIISSSSSSYFNSPCSFLTSVIAGEGFSLGVI